jgi:site-specific DNA recombinase
MRIPRHKPRKDAATNGSAPNAVLYARVSSKEQEQGYSIPAQQELLRRYAAQKGVAVAREFVDVESAKASGRPGFVAMVEYLRQNPGCRMVLAEKTDRLYRNLKDYVTMDELGVEIHMVKENEILSRSSRSAQKFMHGIRVLMAKNYIDNLSEEVKKGLHTKASQKLWPSFAPPGYRNMVSAAGKRIISPDPVLGPVVTWLFEWFASGEYSLKSLARKAYAEGFRFRKSQNKVPVATLQKILRKRIYMGDFDYAGVRYPGSHEPLVPRETWERVQDILNGRQMKVGKGRREFAYSGMVRCGHCGCSLVGELKKGRYVYYHCTGYRGKCGEPYTREEALEQQFAEQLRELILSPAMVRWLRTDVVESKETEEAARARALQDYQVALDATLARLNLLYEDRLDGRIDAATYDRKAKETRGQLERIQQRIQGAGEIRLPPSSQAVDLIMRTSEAAEGFPEQGGEEQRRLLQVVLKEASWKGGELRMSLKEPFEKLRLSNSANYGNHKGLEAKTLDFDNWRRGGDSNPRYSF